MYLYTWKYIYIYSISCLFKSLLICSIKVYFGRFMLTNYIYRFELRCKSKCVFSWGVSKKVLLCYCLCMCLFFFLFLGHFFFLFFSPWFEPEMQQSFLLDLIKVFLCFLIKDIIIENITSLLNIEIVTRSWWINRIILPPSGTLLIYFSQNQMKKKN